MTEHFLSDFAEFFQENGARQSDLNSGLEQKPALRKYFFHEHISLPGRFCQYVTSGKWKKLLKPVFVISISKVDYNKGEPIIFDFHLFY